MPQTPAAQVAVPFVPLHTTPQPPQLVGLVLTLDSQPLAMLLSQLPKPALQVIAHTPLAQPGVPLALEHTVAQLLQCVGSLSRFTSQPFAPLPSQLPQPALQAMLQTPAAQLAVPWLVLHAVVHAPQCVGSVFRFVSQPFATLPSQFEYPALHVMVHVPLVHPAVPLVELHTLPHDPQLATLVLVFTSHPVSASPSQLP
jgi:hypothetical protein